MLTPRTPGRRRRTPYVDPFLERKPFRPKPVPLPDGGQRVPTKEELVEQYLDARIAHPASRVGQFGIDHGKATRFADRTTELFEAAYAGLPTRRGERGWPIRQKPVTSDFGHFDFTEDPLPPPEELLGGRAQGAAIGRPAETRSLLGKGFGGVRNAQAGPVVHDARQKGGKRRLHQLSGQRELPELSIPAAPFARPDADTPVDPDLQLWTDGGPVSPDMPGRAGAAPAETESPDGPTSPRGRAGGPATGAADGSEGAPKEVVLLPITAEYAPHLNDERANTYDWILVSHLAYAVAPLVLDETDPLHQGALQTLEGIVGDDPDVLWRPGFPNLQGVTETIISAFQSAHELEVTGYIERGSETETRIWETLRADPIRFAAFSEGVIDSLIADGSMTRNRTGDAIPDWSLDLTPLETLGLAVDLLPVIGDAKEAVEIALLFGQIADAEAEGNTELANGLRWQVGYRIPLFFVPGAAAIALPRLFRRVRRARRAAEGASGPDLPRETVETLLNDIPVLVRQTDEKIAHEANALLDEFSGMRRSETFVASRIVRQSGGDLVQELQAAEIALDFDDAISKAIGRTGERYVDDLLLDSGRILVRDPRDRTLHVVDAAGGGHDPIPDHLFLEHVGPPIPYENFREAVDNLGEFIDQNLWTYRAADSKAASSGLTEAQRILHAVLPVSGAEATRIGQRLNPSELILFRLPVHRIPDDLLRDAFSAVLASKVRSGEMTQAMSDRVVTVLMGEVRNRAGRGAGDTLGQVLVMAVATVGLMGVAATDSGE